MNKLELKARVRLYERYAEEALVAAGAATDAVTQKQWNVLAEGWLKLAQHTEGLCKENPD